MSYEPEYEEDSWSEPEEPPYEPRRKTDPEDQIGCIPFCIIAIIIYFIFYQITK